MNYTATIEVRKDFDMLYEALLPEKDPEGYNRASWTLEKDRDRLIIHLDAKDATAFRAMLNSIERALIVNEKVRLIK